MAKYRTPGVYIEETPNFPLTIVSVDSAIPAFAGYTEKAYLNAPDDLLNVPYRVSSLLDYENHFGGADPERNSIEIAFDNTGGGLKVHGKVDEGKRSRFLMYYSLQMFFLNGGGPCWIVSVGDYTSTGGEIKNEDLKRGLDEVEKIDEVTLLNFPDAMNLSDGIAYYQLYKEAIDQCAKLRDRFTVLDVYHNYNNDNWGNDVSFLRSELSRDTDHLKYAAVYFPRIYTSVSFNVSEDAIRIASTGAGDLPSTLAGLKGTNDTYYLMAIEAISGIRMLLPASPAVIGIYAQVDSSRGVWKAPANISINGADGPEYHISDRQQQDLNVDVNAGKSINVIRSFTGKGVMVWGARTLAGNSNEWRYVSVSRFFIMVEESVKNATGQFVFEPNDANTWVKVISMIENYLLLLWRSGALMATKPEEAYYVNVGLGKTMTALDILEGRMIVEIGMAVVRPAEFIILRFMHKMLQES